MSAKRKYIAWEINSEDFFQCKTNEERIRFLLRFAVLAPSSHNSQPWKFIIHRDRLDVIISPDQKRMLKQSDGEMRELFISLGCAAENLIIAAEFFGYTSELTYVQHEDDFALSLHMEPSDRRGGNTKLFSALTTRCTNRSSYTTDAVSSIELPLRLQSTEVMAHFVSDREKINKLADITLDAIDTAMSDSGFRRELSGYIINNYSCSPTGMPGFTIGVPNLFSLILPFLIRFLPPPTSQRKQNEILLKEQTSSCLVITAPHDVPEDWTKVGQTYEHIALLGASCGIYTHPMAASVEIGNFFTQVQDVIGTGGRPLFFARIGKPVDEVPHSPRLPVPQVLES